MFPFDIDDLEEDIVEEIENSDVPSDFEIDFDTGKLTGKIISGKDAVVQWVRIVLGINRYYYEQYSWNFGSELQELIGKGGSIESLKTEAERMILDALHTSEYINSIEDMNIEIEGEKLTAKFTIITSFGDSEVEINV